MKQISKSLTVSIQDYIQSDRIIPSNISKPQWFGQKNPKFSYEETFYIFDEEELKGVKKAAQLAKKCLHKAQELFQTVQDGEELDKKITDFIIQQNAYPSGIGFMGFPKTLCISPNDVLVHGVPNQYIFKKGDIVNLDITLYYGGYYGDNSVTVVKEETNPLLQKLVFQQDKCKLRISF